MWFITILDIQLLEKFSNLLEEINLETFEFQITNGSRVVFKSPKKEQKVKIWRKYDHKIPNLFLDLGIHLFNLSYFLINKTPTSILCDVQNKKLSNRPQRFNKL